MMKRTIKIVFAYLVIMNAAAFGQSIPTTGHPVEEAYRRAQLNGNLDSSVSFTIRPLVPSAAFPKDSLNADLSKWTAFTGIRSANGKSGIGLLPLTWNQQYNSAVPYGWNDGAMIPARGYQTLFSAGVFAKLGPLSIQLKPEFVFAQNREFQDIDIYQGMPDLPSRFGKGSYSRANWGQSNIRFTAGPVSLGLSNENLWWGPGTRNSILMSDNASGFKHLTFNSVRPVKTLIGSFEFQMIGGRLEGSGFSPYESDPTYREWRYLSSLTVSYQPKITPGLFLGFTRSFQTYHTNLTSFSAYVPLFAPFQKVKDKDNVSGADLEDQQIAAYIRWLFIRAKAEVYFEYGINDHSYNFRDFIMSPEHSRSYLFGLRKLIDINRNGQQVEVNAEVTQMSQSIDRILRNAGMWYEHSVMLRGYTHQGEVLGAGIGPGGNLQSIEVNWIKSLKKVGFQFERYVHNNDYYNVSVGDLDGQSRRWVDFGFAAIGTWDYKNLLLNAKLQGIQSLNYQWQLKNYTPGTYYIPENDLFNVHAELGVMYRF
jgi:hypothetical protein